ncbi:MULTISPECIES: calcium-binding protein [unclassified Rhodanobacter]|uniref:calcium-binding protein n=1 Tax=unclassified Rhodanobacter TaxID=2621553 RepID=UPI000B32BD52|nr:MULTISPECIES: calcium-binding protein [unclassified Rhodanobacter]
MTSNLEYAQLATHVYARSDENRTPLTDGWTQISRQEDDTWGFSAGAYQRGNEIVISFAGTNETMDWASNVPAGIGLGAFQVTEALDFVLGIMAQNPGATFSLTGHSLGGGLASVMAVFLDLQATVFDPAPFELSARNDVLLGALQTYLLTSGYNNAAFDAYTSSLGALFSQREPNVVSYSTDGEVLEYLRLTLPTIQGTAYEYAVGTPSALEAIPGSMAISLHSMDLLSSVMRSQAFNTGLIEQNRAFSVFSDTSLYAADTRSDKRDFMASLHNRQLASGTGGSGILDVVGADLQKIGTSGTAFEEDINRGVLATLAEYYYFQAPSTSLEFVDAVQGGITLDLSKIAGGSDRKGQDMLLANLKDWLADEEAHLPDFGQVQRVTLQSGGAGLQMAVESDDKSDVVIGGEGSDQISTGGGGDFIFGLDGADIIRGGAGKDEIYGGDGGDTLYAGSSADDADTSENRLYGGWGDDTLYGSAGKDYLDAGGNTDTLKGGNGFDVYKIDNLDTIDDSDGKGVVYRGNKQLAGGTHNEGDPENVYYGGGDVYVLNGTTLVINGGLTIENYDKDKSSLQIVLRDDDDDDDEGPSTDEASTRTSPIVIDLDGDGVETLALGATHFDHDADGLSEASGWVSPDDGLLVYDRNGDQRISNGTELFGSHSVLASGEQAENGFQALAEFDDNGDGVVDAQDASYASLRVWRDLNSNGISDAGELQTLAEAGVASISTSYADSTHVDTNGHEHRQVATVVLSNGTASTAADVWFKIDAGERVNSGDIDLTADVLFLPNAKGFGKVQDLRQAMALDPQLKTLLEQYIGTTDFTIKNQLLDDLIYRWAGADDVDPYSRDPKQVYGHVMDARQLVTLENLVGHDYMGVWCWGEHDPNPHGKAAPLLIAEYLEFKRFTAAQLAAQTDYADDLDIIRSAFGSDSLGTSVDWDSLQGKLSSLYASGQVDRIAGILSVLTDLGMYSSGYRAKRDAAFQAIAASSVELAPFLDFSSRIGTAGNDTLYGTDAGSIFFGLAGDDRLYGSVTGDSYHFSRGHGNDTILDRGGLDQVVLGEGITQADLTFTRNATTVWIHVKNADGSDGGSLRIDNFFDFDGTVDFSAIELIRFADGTSFSQQQILAILTATSITSGNDLVFGTAAGDTINALAGNDDIHGLAGNDQLSGGAGDDELMGDDGADTLSGGIGNDSLVGGRGNDTYLFDAGHGNDVISNAAEAASGKVDRLVFGEGIDPTTVTAKRIGNDLLLQISASDSVRMTNYFNAEAADGTAVDEIAFHDGTVWDIADIKAQVLQATAGDDVINGYASGDVLIGLAGNDGLFGNGGNDTLDGGDGNDTLDGGTGNDVLAGALGADSLRGGEGDDQLDGGAGNDSLQGASGDDLLVGGDGNDELDGGAGRDTLQGGTGGDWLNGGVGDDILEGGFGNDALQGGAGSDIYTFNAGDGQDTIDNYDASAGRVDALVFGAGIDPTQVTARRSGDHLVLTFAGSEDRVTVNHYFVGDVAGGYQLDQIRFADGTAWNVDTIKLLVLTATTGADTLHGYETTDSLAGGEGNDTLYGHGGNDMLQGQSGDDIVYGGAGNDQATGEVGNDVLNGEDGDDTLDGGAGNDTLRGGAGTDHLAGGFGDDRLEGGEGDDFYHFAAGDGHDIISDTQGLSTIYLSGLPLGEVFFRREQTALGVYFLNSPDDRILLADFFDPVTELARHGLRLDMGDGQVWVLDMAALDAASMAGTTLDDVIFGNTLDNTIEGLAGNDALRGGAGADNLDGGTGNDVLQGQDGNDLLSGGEGNDLLDGGTGQDQLAGGAGDDIYVVEDVGDVVTEQANGGYDIVRSSVSHILSLDVERLELTGSAAIDGTGNELDNALVGNNGDNMLSGRDGDDTLFGFGGSDTLIGGAGNDQLDGGYGNDVMSGGTGDDTYSVDAPDDVIVELAGEGHDVAFATSSYALSDNIEKLVLAEGGGASDGTGNASDNELVGNSQDNRLDGGSGADSMTGGLGNDTYVVDDAGDVIVENADEGTDTVESSIDYVLGATLENLTLLGTANLNGTGNDQDNVLIGNDGNNRLEGGLGADSLHGGLGNDYFIEESSADWVYENLDEGLDTVERRYETNLVLKDNVENLILASGVTTGNGNELDNTITGNTGDNTLGGWDGDDLLQGLAGDDALFGGNGSDRLTGDGGNDYLDGGAGIDQLEGGAGNDVYITDDSADIVTEDANAGTDQVQTTASYTLSANIENLFLMDGAGAIDGTGNALDNYLAGNDDSNVLNGMGGSDTMVAGGGDDLLIGGTGDDKYVFDATSGSDVVDNTGGGNDGVFFTNGVNRDRLSFGRDGDDLLIFVDAATAPSVRVTNHFLGGDAAIDYVQPDGGFMLTTAQINQIVAGGSTGGQYDQVIEGTAAAEQLVGSAGKDLIKGLAGDDQLFGLAGDDTLQGGDGDDYLAGGGGSGSGSGADRLEGGAGSDTLSAEDGTNMLLGGAGDDSYVYGGGQDTIDNTDGGFDGVFFNDGITASQLGFSRDGDDLLITVDDNASSTVRITNHFLGGDYAIDYVQPAGGSMLDTAAINALVGGDGGDPGTPGEPGNDSDYTTTVDGTAAGEQLLGTNGRDLIHGLGGNDTIFGFGGDDKFVGGDGDDYLSGGNGSFSGSGNDILIGGAGVDTLVGEDGNDLLLGGAGNDKYVWQADSGGDVIDNTGGGTDWLFFNGVNRARLSFHRSGDDLIVLVDGDEAQQVRVQNHFLGGDLAISYVQPSDGYAIPASQFGSLLTPLPAGFTAASFSPSSMSAMSLAPDAQAMAFGTNDAAYSVTDSTYSDVLLDKRGRLHAALWDWPSEQGSIHRESHVRSIDSVARFGEGVSVSREAQQLIEAMSRFNPVSGASESHEDSAWNGSTLMLSHVTDHPFKQRSTVSAL